MKFTGWKNEEKIELDIPEVEATHVAHLERGVKKIDIWFAENKFYRQIEVRQISQQIEIKPDDKPETWAVHKSYGNYIFLAVYANEPFFDQTRNRFSNSTCVVDTLPRLIDYVNAKSIPDGVDAERNEWAIARYFKFDPVKRVRELESVPTQCVVVSSPFLQNKVYSTNPKLYEALRTKFGSVVQLESDKIIVKRGGLQRITTEDVISLIREQGYEVENASDLHTDVRVENGFRRVFVYDYTPILKKLLIQQYGDVSEDEGRLGVLRVEGLDSATLRTFIQSLGYPVE